MKYVVQLATHVYSLNGDVQLKNLEHRYEVNSIKKKVSTTSLDGFVASKKLFALDSFDTVVIEEGSNANLWIGRYTVLVDDLESVNTKEIYSDIAQEIISKIAEKQQELMDMVTITTKQLR